MIIKILEFSLEGLMGGVRPLLDFLSRLWWKDRMDLISEEQNIDRISDLPNHLIGHILSFLSTKEAIRTCVLSTHWNQQWTSLTHLDFDEDEMFRRDYPISPSSFVNFVYRVLLFKGSRLDTFRLRWCLEKYSAIRVRDWLSAALSRNVRQVDLEVYWNKLYDIQFDYLFSSRTLEVLKLGKGFLLRVPMVISFDNLKILHLNRVEFEDGESLSTFISSCPALEELMLNEIISDSVNVVNISSLSLKRLILKYLYSFWFQDDDDIQFHQIVLNTPYLQYLEHKENTYLPSGYTIETLQCLDKARLNFDMSLGFSDIGIVSRGLNAVGNLYLAITNVRSLYISGRLFEIFNYVCGDRKIKPPNFPRLTDLEIGRTYSYEEELTFLTIFLQTTPQLASLSFSVGYWKEFWDPPTKVPFCMLHNLKVVEVNGVFGRELELRIVKYFLEKTNCLEELIVSFEGQEIEEFINKVLSLPRASNSCKIGRRSKVLDQED